MRTVFGIRNTAGELIAEHVRVDWPGGRKRMYWQLPGCDPRDGLGGLSTPDLPLFGTEVLRYLEIGETVVVCEGERAALAVADLGIPALGTVTGTSAIPGEGALSVLLGFDVVLWPDHDRVGWLHMNRIAHALVRLGGSLPHFVSPLARLYDGTAVHFVAPKGFDAADVHEPRDTIPQMIGAAEPWDLHAEQPRAARPARPSYDRFESEQRVATARARLLQIVEQRIGPPHEMRGGTPWWRCPFHNEKGPSFKVDVREPFFRCFGCGARGDVFDFLARIEGVGFKDALTELAPPKLLGAAIPW